ncbi:MAG: hypothetical protein SFV81_10120 [Pirellulaceae bacterium]|nr:hypothetical protein [Pirellulaceae bacterium]
MPQHAILPSGLSIVATSEHESVYGPPAWVFLAAMDIPGITFAIRFLRLSITDSNGPFS